MKDQDTCQRFTFEKAAIRGQLVHLNASYEQALTQHHYPPVIRELLGETLVSAVLLAETIKFEGQLTLQLQGDGPVTLLVAKCNSQGEIRGLAQWRDDVTPINVPAALGNGQLVVTIEYAKKIQPYQSIIPINRQTVSQALESYFATSEQMPTRLFAVSDPRGAAGLLLQALPCESDDDEQIWQETSILAETVKKDELLNLDNEILLQRLFHEHDMRVYSSKPVVFNCPCSVERMQRAIITLGEKEANSVLAEKREILVHCEYCNNEYAFDKAEVQNLFKKH